MVVSALLALLSSRSVVVECCETGEGPVDGIFEAPVSTCSYNGSVVCVCVCVYFGLLAWFTKSSTVSREQGSTPTLCNIHIHILPPVPSYNSCHTDINVVYKMKLTTPQVPMARRVEVTLPSLNEKDHNLINELKEHLLDSEECYHTRLSV